MNISALLWRTCINVRRLLLARNDVRLRMCVKQFLGNDTSWLLLRFNDWILDRRQTTSGTVISGVLVTVSSSSSDVHVDSSWTKSSVTLDWVPEQSTINFVHASWPSSGEQLHWAGHRDFRAAVTSSSVVHVTLSISGLHWVEMTSLTRPSEVSGFLWPSIWLAATNTALPVYASVASHRWKWVARIATRIQFMTLSVVNASTFSHTSQKSKQIYVRMLEINASSCQIWWWSTTHLPQIHNKAVFFRFSRWQPSAILDFQKFAFLAVGRVDEWANVRHRAIFHGNRTNHCWDMVIFRSFQYGSRPPSWICCAIVWTTHKEHLVVFITVQNFAGIDKVVLLICLFVYLRPKFVFGGWHRKRRRGAISNETQITHILARVCVVWAIMRENPSSIHTCSFNSRDSWELSQCMKSSLATHALTGCNITNKFGTNAAGIKPEPVLYLKDFRRAHADV